MSWTNIILQSLILLTNIYINIINIINTYTATYNMITK